ncbi:PREDICTED: uncharacterized protein LOC104591985 [Nelumbo nucifera]|uniref:Uncharacterized protein n=2 Tax=Nelumbo nucifera TaxID=4432 RepID=A0A822YGP8_NELNU|nr:PREDICTED: uncharacterized protein LOC104591985 [Nelumbo nucifera]DAD30651.1 TPA_asm: hypothetical protein HUJ06_009502 [Nelumbo nucifera]
MASAYNRWSRPEVYPLMVALGGVVGLCAFQLVRNICSNPDVRVNKQKRSEGVFDNFEEGKNYKEHSIRKFLRNRPPEVMPSVNKFFSEPKEKHN